jgi:hypothetical protein
MRFVPTMSMQTFHDLLDCECSQPCGVNFCKRFGLLVAEPATRSNANNAALLLFYRLHDEL